MNVLDLCCGAGGCSMGYDWDIRISESSESDCTEFFTRHITDISTVGEVAGKDLFLFSWNSNEVSA